MSTERADRYQGPTRLTQPKLLIVEGKDEQFFFDALLAAMGHRSDVQICPQGGKDKLARYIRTLTQTPGFDDQANKVNAIGIVRDADDNPDAAFQSISNALKDGNLPVPPHPMQLAGGDPQVIVFITPGNHRPGALEDLCLWSVQDNPATPCVNSFFQCLREKLPGDDLPKNLSKAKVQAFLASRKHTVRDLGVAAKKKYWGDWEHEAFSEIREFLQTICTT